MCAQLPSDIIRQWLLRLRLQHRSVWIRSRRLCSDAVPAGIILQHDKCSKISFASSPRQNARRCGVLWPIVWLALVGRRSCIGSGSSHVALRCSMRQCCVWIRRLRLSCSETPARTDSGMQCDHVAMAMDLIGMESVASLSAGMVHRSRGKRCRCRDAVCGHFSIFVVISHGRRGGVGRGVGRGWGNPGGVTGRVGVVCGAEWCDASTDVGVA